MEKERKEIVVNRLIAGLPHADGAAILKHCKTVDMTFGEILCEPDQPIEHVYFPISGFISLVTTIRGHKPLEMGLIGNEGILGATVVLGVNSVPLQAVVQGSGTALSIAVPQLKKLIRSIPTLHNALNQYLYVLVAQLSKISACTHFHEVEFRLARWLLMTHDRSHSDHFELTHQFLADMLGVQRSAITIAAGTLQHKKIIRYTRGKILILDRKGLEASACECYQVVLNDYARLLK
jgi:CRP-like cAMP-binding protein